MGSLADKLVEINDMDRETALREISKASHSILSNPVIEDYSIEII